MEQEELFLLMCGRLGCEVVAEQHLRRPAVTADIRLRIPREEAEALLVEARAAGVEGMTSATDSPLFHRTAERRANPD